MIIRTVMLGAAALLLAAGAQAQTKWDMPTPYSEGEFHTRNVKSFVEDVKGATGGRLDIVVHSNGSLIKHPDILRAVTSGQVNIAEFLLSQFGNEDPVFEADNIPFVAAGYDDAWKFYQAQKPLLEKKLQGRGLRLLYSVAWPGQGIYTKEPLKSVADLKGTKFRTYSPLTARLAELLGASPTVVQVPDVPQMFATGGIQAMITSSATHTASSLPNCDSRNSAMLTWPLDTARRMSGCLMSDPAVCSVMSSPPLVACFTSSANCLMLRVWNSPSE